MVRNFAGHGYQNGRQSQFTFVTGTSPRKSAIPLTEAERKGKIDNLSQFVEGVPETQIRATLMKHHWDDEAALEDLMDKAITAKQEADQQTMQI